jgi:peptidoglycan/xylan/chitin deacetylase (PgdA/CDA1 family)
MTSNQLRAKPDCGGRQTIALAVAVWLSLLAQNRPAVAADCPDKHALGTARTLSLSVADNPRIGLKVFPKTLPLEDKEVVLTFDDGPFPPTTRRVLVALADQCVRATFFLIGQNAAHNPDLVRKIAADGHTIGTHTWSHRILARVSERAANEEIDRGVAAVEAIVGAPSGPSPTDAKADQQGTPATPVRFFRFPGFVSTPKLLQSLNDRGFVVFGADLWASDWNRMSPDQELHQVIGRLKAARKGIILFHDIKAQTAAMLPSFLHYLKDNGYRVVQVVPQIEAGAPGGGK